MPVPILLYHHIGTPPSSGIPGRSNYVTPQNFEKQMMWLNRLGFKGVSLKEGMPYLRGEKAGKIATMDFYLFINMRCLYSIGWDLPQPIFLLLNVWGLITLGTTSKRNVIKL